MRTAFTVLFAAAGFVLAAAAPAAADCKALDGAVRQAIASGDIAALPGLAERIGQEKSCDGTYVETARSQIALAYLSVGQKPDGSFTPEFVTGAAAIARPWQVSMALGDLRYGEKDYAAATQAYERAIDDIRNPRLVPAAPGKDIEEYLFKRAYQARSLSPTYVSSRSRGGEIGGAMAQTFRSFTAVAVPVPIRFDTDEASLTPDGQKAADELYAYLSSKKPAAVVLIGHTDERGSDGHNDALSLARARAVADYLTGKGLASVIKVEGHGKHEPFAADDRTKYSEDDLYTFDRRVEYRIVQ